MSGPTRFVQWLYGCLVRLYPSTYRDEFEQEMLADFEDALRDASVTQQLGLFAREARDVPAAALRLSLTPASSRSLAYLALIFMLMVLVWQLSGASVLLPYLLVLAALVLVFWTFAFERETIRPFVLVLVIGTALVLFEFPAWQAFLPRSLGSILGTIWFVLGTTVAARLAFAMVTGRMAVWRLILYLLVVLLILAQSSTALVQAALWDELEDGLSAIFLWYTAILSALVIVIVWFWQAPTRRFLGILFALLILMGGWIVLLFGLGLSPARLTAERAQIVRDALVQYHANTGHFPSTLAELSPRYLLLVPQPIMFEYKSWCYETRNDGYRFGYLYRSGYGARASVRMVGAQGIDAALTWQCEEDAAAHNETRFSP